MNTVKDDIPNGLVNLLAHAMDGGSSTFVVYHFVLDQKINFDLMEKALIKCSNRYKYFNKKIVIDNETIKFQSIDTRIRLYRDSLDYIINEKDNNGYLYRVGINESTLIVSFFHCLTDGVGMLKFIRTLLFEYYQSLYSNIKLDKPKDLIEVESLIDQNEYVNPMSFVPSNIDGEMRKANKFYKFPMSKNINTYHAYTFTCKQDKLMNYAKKCNGSPNSVMSYLLAKAIQNVYPTSINNGIEIGIAIDIKKILGIDESFMPCLHNSIYRFDENIFAEEDKTINSLIRSDLKSFCEKDNIYKAINTTRIVDKIFSFMKTYKAKHLLASQSTLKPKSTATVSYVGIVDFGDVSKHIKSIENYVDTCAPILEIYCLNEYFYFTLCSSLDINELACSLYDECNSLGFKCRDLESKTFNIKLTDRSHPKMGFNKETVEMLLAIKKYKSLKK